MGVEGLFKIVSKKMPKTLEAHNLASYKGMRIAIDLSGYVYAWQSIGDKFSIKSNHIRGLLAQIASFKLHSIKPLYVFDGAPSAAKEAALTARKEVAGRVRVPREVWADCLELFAATGAPYIYAEGESDHLLAALYSRGLVDYILTEDSDLLPLGARILRKAKGTKMRFCEIDSREVMGTLGLTQTQFIDYCLLIGTDYSTAILTPTKALVAAKNGAVPDKIRALRSEFSLPKNIPATHQGAFNAAILKAILMRNGLTEVRTVDEYYRILCSN